MVGLSLVVFNISCVHYEGLNVHSLRFHDLALILAHPGTPRRGGIDEASLVAALHERLRRVTENNSILMCCEYIVPSKNGESRMH